MHAPKRTSLARFLLFFLPHSDVDRPFSFRGHHHCSRRARAHRTCVHLRYVSGRVADTVRVRTRPVNGVGGGGCDAATSSSAPACVRLIRVYARAGAASVCVCAHARACVCVYNCGQHGAGLVFWWRTNASAPGRPYKWRSSALKRRRAPAATTPASHPDYRSRLSYFYIRHFAVNSRHPFFFFFTGVFRLFFFSPIFFKFFPTPFFTRTHTAPVPRSYASIYIHIHIYQHVHTHIYVLCTREGKKTLVCMSIGIHLYVVDFISVLMRKANPRNRWTPKYYDALRWVYVPDNENRLRFVLPMSTTACQWLL